jgi:hypothetical protein
MEAIATRAPDLGIKEQVGSNVLPICVVSCCVAMSCLVLSYVVESCFVFSSRLVSSRLVSSCIFSSYLLLSLPLPLLRTGPKHHTTMGTGDLPPSSLPLALRTGSTRAYLSERVRVRCTQSLLGLRLR